MCAVEAVLNRLSEVSSPAVRLVICDLSAAPYLDLAGSRMLHELHAVFAGRTITFRIIGAHGSVRDLLRADGIEDKVEAIGRAVTIHKLLIAHGFVASTYK